MTIEKTLLEQKFQAETRTVITGVVDIVVASYQGAALHSSAINQYSAKYRLFNSGE